MLRSLLTLALSMFLLAEASAQTAPAASAKTTTVNIASQKLLEKNGFIRIRTGDEEFEMNEQKMRFVYYVWEKQN